MGGFRVTVPRGVHSKKTAETDGLWLRFPSDPRLLFPLPFSRQIWEGADLVTISNYGGSL